LSPKISIVLPTYNGERYISQSIESIRKQSYINWELIIVDDCSTDNTINIIDKYVHDDKRIKVIHNSINYKLPRSLNVGFREAKGEYLTWTSDDNLYYDNALEVMKNELEKNNNIYMVCAQMMNIDDKGENLGIQFTGNVQNFFLNNNIGACFMYRRIILEEIGEYDADLFLVEDYDYWLRIAEFYGDIERILKPLYYYRRHENSLSFTKKSLVTKQIKKLKEKHINLLLNRFKNNTLMICRLYCDYMLNNGDEDIIKGEISPIVYQLKKMGKNLKYNNIIIMGAGKVGREAANQMNGKVIAFSDNDIKKIGTFEQGLPVLSFQEIIKREDIEIIIAVSEQYICELLEQFLSYNIEKFDVYQFWIRRTKNMEV